VAQKSADSETDFASWAEHQKSEWSQGERQSPESVQAADDKKPDAAASVVKSMSRNAPRDFSTPDFDDPEKAQPLIRQPENLKSPSFAQTEPELAFEQPAKPAPAEEKNPFDFEEHQPVAANPRKQPSTQPPGQSSSTRKSLDDSFQMDNGWKPAHLTRP
jgi:hypothetical protein